MMRDFSSVRRVVVKVGTNLLSCESGIDEGCIDVIVDQLAQLQSLGYQVLLVSSGAIGMGAKELSLKGPVKQVPMRQACASIGQPLLMSSYRRSFKRHGMVCSQILLTRNDLNNRLTYVNLRNSVFTLLDLGVIPIFNENDVVSTAEIGTAFVDNDRMSAMVASKIDADLLVILTDITGLYTADPKKDKEAVLLSDITSLDATILSYAGGAGSTHSIGGMKTKLLAAKIARMAGCTTIIASGYEGNVLPRLLTGEVLGTCIHSVKRLSQRQRWILYNSHLGSIVIDDGAKKALIAKKSLLPKGIVSVEGVFGAGDVVQICTTDGKPFAKAVPYYNSTEIAAVAGHSSKDIHKIIKEGHKGVIFRPEDLVLLNDDD
ncbi:glutamate 5-kinase [Sphaerochaeta sp. S2]|uniref:glutamate 5-kinase n=1 Tax=Sphaerochaeta sp. S2 TaxID=2798868 RepID=UPI0018EA0DDD|nr:glutamate 5-kinase [Sphaerochaeta sp. S2]MBJ2356842.1 glutamate 5-kinase [Sphaerochaeta sp. S2]